MREPRLPTAQDLRHTMCERPSQSQALSHQYLDACKKPFTFQHKEEHENLHGHIRSPGRDHPQRARSQMIFYTPTSFQSKERIVHDDEQAELLATSGEGENQLHRELD